MELKEIRLDDLKELGASFIRSNDIKRDVSSGTIYYYFSKYDEELSSAEVTVHYFPKGGAEIIGPNPDGDEGYDKLMEYLENLCKQDYIKDRIRKRRIMKYTFLTIKTVIAMVILISLACAFTTGDIQIWENTIIETILLIIIHMGHLRSMRI